MIAKFMPLAFVAIYTVAAFVPTVIEAPLNALERIAGSKIAHAWAVNDMQQIREIYQKSSLYLFLLGGFLFLLINVNIHTMLKFLPVGYEAGEYVVMIISLGTLYNMATGLNAPVLFNSPKYRYGAFFLILLAVIVLVMQMLLIPKFGILGAAIATSIAAFTYNSLLLASVWKFFSLQPFDDNNMKVLASILIGFICVYWMPHVENRLLDICIRTLAVSMIYSLLIYYYKVVPEFHRYIPWNRNKQNP
jgi:O-antigen/teichoic acid export membrane protein